MTEARAGSDAWAPAYRRLASRVAHELRNPLNGAVVNLEVLRSRSTRPEVTGAALRPFAESAAAEAARLTELLEALLALARPASGPVDLVSALQPLVVLLDAVARRAGGRVTLVVEEAGDAPAVIDGDAARLHLWGVLEEELEDGRSIACHIRGSTEGPEVYIAGGRARGRASSGDEVTAHAVADGVLIRFPRLSAAGPG